MILAVILSSCTAQSDSNNVTGTTVSSEELTELKEQYPDCFGLDASKGFDILVWQMAPNSYTFALFEHSDIPRDGLFEGWFDMKGVNAEVMRIILSSYSVDKDSIYIIPWQNPISSYIGDYWTMEKDEDPDSVAKRQLDYIDMIRDMLLAADEI